MFKKLFLFMIAATLLTSCTIRLLPPGNAALIADITHLQDDIQSLYDGMIQSQDKTFATNEALYEKVQLQVDAIVVAEQLRPKAKLVIRQAQNVQSLFNQYKNDHKARSTLSARELSIYKEYLYGVLKPLIVSELSIK